ncbi:MAG: DUF5691 domain-containing protein [Saprospiraceae bacterium]
MKDLIRIALLGSDRTEIPADLQQQIKELGVNEKDTARMLLIAATKWRMKQKAGFIPHAHEGQLPLGPDDSNERFCSPKATRYLQQIIEGPYERILPEFFQIAKKENRTLPPEQLPTFLEQASEGPKQAALLKSLMGNHARWLAEQHPVWASLFAEPDLDNWDSGSFQNQLQNFRNFREIDKAKSLELLNGIWPELDHRQKKSFLRTLKHTVDLGDEDFLEMVLEDRRKEVRKEAAILLQSVAGSKLLERTWSHLENLISIKKNKKGEEEPAIELPDEITPEMLRDGIDPRQQWMRGGLRASRLGQMVAIIPPARWEKHFDKNPETLIEVFAKSDYAIILLQALAYAAALHKDDNWAVAILEFWLYHHHIDRWSDFEPKQLCENLSAQAFNRIAIPALDYCDQLPTEEDPITFLIKKNEHAWNKNLTTSFIIKCKEWIAEYSSSYWTAFQLKSMIQNASYYIDPALADSLTKSWPTSSPAWGSWESEIEAFFKVLRFRKGMQEALVEN